MRQILIINTKRMVFETILRGNVFNLSDLPGQPKKHSLISLRTFHVPIQSKLIYFIQFDSGLICSTIFFLVHVYQKMHRSYLLQNWVSKEGSPSNIRYMMFYASKLKVKIWNFSFLPTVCFFNTLAKDARNPPFIL